MRRTRTLLSALPPIPYLSHPNFPSSTLVVPANTLWTPTGSRGVYGGHVVALSILAAESCVPKENTSSARPLPMNSFHSYFLRAGDSQLPTEFKCEVLREGRSFTNVSVSALQDGKSILCSHSSFHAIEADHPAMGHTLLAPSSVPPPETLADTLQGTTVPLDVRPVVYRDHRAPTPIWPPKALVWIKCPPLPPPTPLTAHLHRAAVAFASDWGVGVVSLLPYNLNWNSKPLQIAASLDHCMYFHDSFGGGGGGGGGEKPTSTSGTLPPIHRHPDAPRPPTAPAPPQRADEFLLYEFESEVYRGCRGLNKGRVWSRDGTLLVSFTQESLLRAKSTA